MKHSYSHQCGVDYTDMGFLAVVLTVWCVFTGQVTSTKRVHLNDGQRFQLQLIHLANDVMGLEVMQVSYFLNVETG